MKADSISVVIPLYNKALFVDAAVRSALAQGECVREVIVVDDGSTDDGAAIVSRIDDPRLRLIRQANAGVSAARNNGMRATSCALVAFLDADDYWLDGYGDTIVALATRFTDCAMYGTYYYEEADDGTRVRPRIPMDPASNEPVRIDNLFDALARGQLFCMCSLVVRRDLVFGRRIFFPEGESVGEDLDFYFRLAQHTPMAFSPRPLVCYRHSPQVSRLSSAQSGTAIPRFLLRAVARYRSGEVPSPLRPGLRRLIGGHFESIALSRLLQGERRHAIAALLNRFSLTRLHRTAPLMLLAMLPSGMCRMLLRTRQGELR